jgi:CelD/BcsL family acetyltransferase involved in cellulose biosynthesis
VPVFHLDPLQDTRWEEFLERHPQSSVFHTPGWLRALRRTYGYEPCVVTTAAPGEALRNGIVFCVVKSWLTGKRAVSLPFADHCQPLVESPESFAALIAALREEQASARWKYIELRPLTTKGQGEDETSFGESAQFYFHTLDLRPDLDALYRGLHKSCVQRKIQRAEQENLVYEEGRSESVLAKFYHLLLLTRRRHQLPPQPLAWFRNLLECMGDQGRIHIVSKDGQPVASIFTLFFKKTLVYKYGCSDGRFHKLGGMPLLFWKVVQEGKQRGAQEFDLGRSDTDNPGLVEFKGHLGADASMLRYYCCPPRPSSNSASGWKMRVARSAHLAGCLIRF